MKTFFLIIRDAIASVSGGCAVGFLTMYTLPCNWFGTSSEGACAYGVLWAAVGVGAVLACLLFVGLGYRTLRRQYAGALANITVANRSDPLAPAWLILLVVFWVQLLLVVAWPAVDAEFTRAIVWLAFLGFVLVTILLLRRFQMPVLLSLLLLIPVLGMVLLPSVLFRQVTKLVTTKASALPERQPTPLSS